MELGSNQLPSAIILRISISSDKNTEKVTSLASMGIRIDLRSIDESISNSPRVVHLILASLGWIKSPKLRRFKYFINLIHTIYAAV